MVRLADLPEPARTNYAAMEMPAFPTTPRVAGPPLAERRLAFVSTAGLHRRGDRPFTYREATFRALPPGSESELAMTHISSNYDRTGFVEDPEVVLPLGAMRALKAEGIVGAVADRHYSFMGAADVAALPPHAEALAAILKRDRVDSVVIAGV